MESVRHFGKFQNEEVVVLGYHGSNNSAMIVRPSALPGEEQIELRKIAASTSSQKRDILIPVLQGITHRSGSDWFTYLANRLRGHNPATLLVPMKELTDMNESQQAFFKGYGTSIEGVDAEVQELPTAPVDVVPAPVQATPTAGLQSGPDSVMLALLERIVSGQEETNAQLATLAKKIKPARATRKPRAKTAARKTSAKAAPAETPSPVMTVEPV